MLYIEKPELLNVIEGPSALHGSFGCRPSHVLVFKRSGESVYRFADRTCTLSAGQAIFIPQGTNYTFGKVSEGESRYLLINFHAQMENPQPTVYRLSPYLDFDHFCHQLHKAGMGDTPADRYRVCRLFYQALEAICESERAGDLHTHAARMLIPAMTFLQEHLFDPALKVGQLHTTCGVSDTYFRKLFIARFGVSPKQYVLQKRLQQAKALLEHGEYNSIGQVAQLSGFDDPLYFSRLFRKVYGCPPSEYRT